MEAAHERMDDAGQGRLAPEQRPLPTATGLAALAAAAQILWTTPPDGLVVDLPLWREYTGQSKETVQGIGWLDAVHPADRERTLMAWQRAVALGSLYETEFRLRRRDGVFRDMLTRGVPIRDEQDAIREWVGACTDVTRLKRAEQRLAAQNAVSHILSDAPALEVAMPRLLDAITSQLGWDAANAWLVDGTTATLRFFLEWHTAATMAAASKGTTFACGVGLPGRVWAAGAPEWIPLIEQDANFPRHDAALQAELQSAFAFPLIGKQGVLGVIECFSIVIAPPDPELLQTVDTLGRQIGQFLDHVTAAGAQAASEARITSVLETALDAIIMSDAGGRITEFNPAAERMFGYARAEVVGREMAEVIIPPALRAQHRQGFARYLATGEARVLGQRLEVRGLRKDGTEFPVELAILRIPTPGAPQFTAYLRDISARVALEDALRQTAQAAAERAGRVEAIFEAMADGVMVFDRAGRGVQMNQAAEQLVQQYSSADFAAWTSPERASQTAMRNEQGEYLEPDQTPMARVTRGETLTGAQALDVRMRNRDGDDIFMNVSGAPIRDAAGQIAGGVIVARDVTGRRQFERRTHDALAALLAMAGILVTPELSEGEAQEMAQRLAELARRVLNCQRIAMLRIAPGTESATHLAAAGLTPEQEEQWRLAPALPLRVIFPEDQLDWLYAGEAVIIDYRQPPYDHLPNPYAVQVLPMLPMVVGTELVGLLTFDYGTEFHTYTADELALAEAVAQFAALAIERERLLQERATARSQVLALEATQQRMDTFLALASHEMRTPITAFKGNTQIIERFVGRMLAEAPPDQKDRLRQMQRLASRSGQQIRRIERLITDLLDVTRIQENQLALRRELCDLRAIVHLAAEEQQLIWPQRVLELDLPEDPVMVLADADRLGEVLTNFLSNALKYSREHQPVRAQLTVAEGQARVAVRDQGPGIPLEDQPHIWERFYRAGIEHQSGSQVGLGLGLFICQAIIAQHGGTVGVASVPGAGSEFWFAVPLAGDE